MKPSEWIKAQPAFLGAQGKTIFDPDFDIDDAGLPQEKPSLPRSGHNALLAYELVEVELEP